MHRKCVNCYEYKDEKLFPKRTGGGYQSYCIECKRLLDRQYRRAIRGSKKAC
jgi:guanyl-specific ribonuclease Sa